MEGGGADEISEENLKIFQLRGVVAVGRKGYPQPAQGEDEKEGKIKILKGSKGVVAEVIGQFAGLVNQKKLRYQGEDLDDIKLTSKLSRRIEHETSFELVCSSGDKQSKAKADPFLLK